LPSPDPQIVLTVADAAALLRVSEPTIIRLIRKKKLHRLDVGRRILIPRWSLDQLLQPDRADVQAAVRRFG